MKPARAKAGAIGYCLGGKLAYLMAARSDSDCSVGYYGVGLAELLGEASSIKKPLMLHVAEKDQFVPEEDRDKVMAALGTHPQVKLKLYKGQDHAFARPGGEHYNQDAAELANGRTIGFFPGAFELMAESEMTKAVRIHETGGAEVLRYEDIELAAPAAGEVRLRQEAVGLNYIDVYHRSGLYPLPSLPIVIGLEGAGVVEALGDGVTTLSPGDRVAYAGPPMGAYAAARNMPAARLVKLPEGISTECGAAMMLQGLTAHYLIRRTYPVKAGEIVLFHAAAGGVGLIACQWLKHLGAVVIGTVGSAEKAELATAHGCSHTINYQEENVVARVKEITGGDGVSVVYDSVGKGHLRGLAGLPGAAGHDGFLWQCLRPRTAF